MTHVLYGSACPDKSSFRSNYVKMADELTDLVL